MTASRSASHGSDIAGVCISSFPRIFFFIGGGTHTHTRDTDHTTRSRDSNGVPSVRSRRRVQERTTTRCRVRLRTRRATGPPRAPHSARAGGPGVPSSVERARGSARG